MSSCKMTPDARNNNNPSQLFIDLNKLLGRDKAKDIWAKTSTKQFRDAFDDLIPTDNNGDYTLEGLLEFTNLLDFVSEDTLKEITLKDMNISKEEKLENSFSSADNVFERVKSFMRKSKLRDVSKVSVEVNKETNNLDVTIEKSKSAKADNQKLVHNHIVNQKLRQLLNKWGVGINALESVEGLDYNGYVSFNNVQFCNNLAMVISLAKGEKGEEVLPEEFSHFLIRVKKDDPIVKRFITALRESPESMFNVLQDQFDQYIEKYNGNMDLVAEECAGKILAEALVNSDQYDLSEDDFGQNASGITGQAVNRVKDFLASKQESDVLNILDEAFDEIQLLASEIAKNVFTNENYIQKQNIDWDKFQADEALYNLKKEKKDMIEHLDNLVKNSFKFQKMFYKKFNKNKKEGEEYEFFNASGVESLMNDLKDDIKTPQQVLEDITSYFDELQKQANGLYHLLKNLNPEKLSNEGLARQLTRAISQKEYYDLCKDDLIDLMEYYGLDRESETYNKYRSLLNALNKATVTAENLIRSNASNIFINFLKNVVGKDEITIPFGKYKNKPIRIEDALTTVTQDIGFLETWLTSMCNSSDWTLGAFDKAVKIAREKGRFDTLDAVKQLQSIALDAESKGVNINELMHERDEKGNLTGRYISKYDWVKYNRDLQAFMDSLPKADKQDLKLQRSNENKIIEWKREHSDLVEEEDGTKFYAPKEELYHNEKFDALMENPANKEFYDKFMTLYRKHTKQVTGHHWSKMIMIRKSFMEELYSNNSLAEKVENIWRRKFDSIIKNESDTEYVTNGCFDFNGKPVDTLPTYYQFDTEGQEDKLKDFSTDLVSNACMYFAMSNRFSQMNKIINQLEISKYVLEEKRRVEATKWGKPVTEEDSHGNKTIATKSFKESYLSKRLDKFFEMAVYGRYYESLGDINIFGKSISIDKILDAIRGLGAKGNLGYNILAQIANLNGGIHQTRIERACKEFFSFNDLKEADKLFFTKLMPAYLANLAKRVKNDKLNLFIEHFNIKNDFEKIMSETDWYKKDNVVKRFLGDRLGFLGNELGDTWLYSRIALALAFNTHFTNSKGETINLLDAYEEYEVAKGVKALRIKRGLKDENGKGVITDQELKERKAEAIKNAQSDDEAKLLKSKPLKYFLKENEIEEAKVTFAFTSKNIGLGQEIFGVYSKDDKPAATQTAIGRLLFQFRDWMPPSVQRRWQRAHYNHMLDRGVEGFDRTLARFILDCSQDIRKGKLNIRTKFNELSKEEQQNIKRALYDINTYLAICAMNALTLAFVLPFALGGGDGDDDDKSKLFSKKNEDISNHLIKLAFYISKRQETEVGSLIPIWFPGANMGMPSEMWKMLRSPAASISTMENISDLFGIVNPWNWAEAAKEGDPPKGLKIMLNSYFNPLRGIYKSIDINNKIKFFLYE